MDNCTFQPKFYETKQNNEQTRPRNVAQFIKDQEKYLEYKSLNSKKRQDEKAQKEKEIYTKKPQVDNLSKQIVELMHERKDEEIYERLYKKGKDKLLATTKDAITQNTNSMRELEKTTRSIRTASAINSSPTRASRGGKATSMSLYNLNKINKDKLERKRELKV